MRALVSNSVDDSERLLLRDLGVRCAESSSGRNTGLKERLPSGVVGAVDPSKATCSSGSTNVVDKGIIPDGGGTMCRRREFAGKQSQRRDDTEMVRIDR